MSVPVKGKIIGYKQLKSKHFQKSSYQEQLAFNAVPLSFKIDFRISSKSRYLSVRYKIKISELKLESEGWHNSFICLIVKLKFENVQDQFLSIAIYEST